MTDNLLFKILGLFGCHYKKNILAACSILFVNSAFSQSIDQPYSYQFYQKLSPVIYSTGTKEHTSIKPFLVTDSLLNRNYDSLMSCQTDKIWYNGPYRKLFNEHLIDLRYNSSTFYADILPDFEFGREFANSKTTSMSSLGFQVGGTVGNKWHFNISGYAERAVFADYLKTYVNQVGIVPGQAYGRITGKNYIAWDYLTGGVFYTANQYLSISLGRGKTFLGDGYRSMLLSDYASPYPYLNLTGTLGNVRYMVMYSYMNDPATTSQFGINQKKFGVFHYLDWNVNNRLSIGFFDNVIGYFRYSNGISKPFDFYYINPIIFLKPINNSSGNPDKSLLGVTSRYKISNDLTVYGQFALNEFESKNFFSNTGSSRNKYGWQLGLRGTNLFNVKGLNYLLETNTAKPYTYQARISVESYSANGEPLAHPWGANFREVVGLLNYSYKRFDFSGEMDFGHYGLDLNGLNYGKDIFKLWTKPIGAPDGSNQSLNNYTGQGLTTNMTYLEGKAAYILNPKYNLRFEVGLVLRDEHNKQFSDHTSLLTIGLRSSFRQIYKDIASYKTH